MFNHKIKVFQSDSGKEFDNGPLKAYFVCNDIHFQKSCPCTPEQNGVAERKHRLIIETAHTFLHDANLPGQFWSDAAYATIFIINWLSTPLLDNHPRFEKLFHRTPDYSFLRVFGCECFPTLLT